MMPTEDYVLSRIAKIILEPSYDGLSVCDALENLHIEAKQYRSERNKEAFERAMNATYRVARIEQGRSYDAMRDQYRPVNTIAEIVQFARRDMADFAKERGLNVGELHEVIESRQKHVVGKNGAIWQAYPSNYVDHAPRQEDLNEIAEDLAEEQRIKARNARRDAARIASAKPEPAMSFYHVTGKQA